MHVFLLEYALQILGGGETFLELFDIMLYKNDPRDDTFLKLYTSFIETSPSMKFIQEKNRIFFFKIRENDKVVLLKN